MLVASIISLALAADPSAAEPSSATTDQAALPLSPVAAPSPQASPDPAVAPLPPASVAPTEPVPDVPTVEELEQHYLRGYAAWQQGRWAAAGEQAQQILEVAPDYRPALLLRGYALTKKADPSEGIAMLQQLAALPAEAEFERAIQQRARLLAARFTDRRRRDQIAFSIGQEVLVEQRSGGLALRTGGALQLQVPVWDMLAARVEYSGAWSESFNALVVDGPHMALMGVLELPMKGPGSYLDVGIGPALWVAKGLYWKSNGRVYGGVRTALGYDWRFSRRTGVRAEAGWSFWPGLQADLPWLTQPLDLRVALTIWMGK